MSKINVKTSQKVTPMMYAYTTPEIKRHDGWTKIGYTEQDVDDRIKEQTYTADVEYKKEWQGTAIYDDGSGDAFKDYQFHAYLSKNNVEREPNKEWFKISGKDSHDMFIDFKSNRGIVKGCLVSEYTLRDEQKQAVDEAFTYAENNDKGEFLWNAKPRFGKTLSAYDLMKKLNCNDVLIVTNRPAIANSWYQDYTQFVGDEDYFYFVSDTDSLRGKKYVVSFDDFSQIRKKHDVGDAKQIRFVSLQDLKGSKYFGGDYNKLKDIKDTKWDLLIIDEAHEGVDTFKTDIAFDHIDRKFTLHLSGTPFKALANEKFKDNAIFNWTYADEQKRKEEWDENHKDDEAMSNPYADMPRLNLFTYQMSKIIEDVVDQGIEIAGETEEYAFDLNEFFATNDNGSFKHGESVDKFLNALTEQEKYPFSTDELRNELKHTLWLLDRVASAKALKKKLEAHPVFKDYKIVLAAGETDAVVIDNKVIRDAYNQVRYAIEHNDKTITLSVGQLTTGITIPEWTGVLMLSNISSPSLYMQAAFRAQNPCLFHVGKEYFRKENSYVFDFDPARTLTIYEDIANGLSQKTTNGKGSVEERTEQIKELINFFPVIGEDEEGRMIELDASKVLSIPRKIKSTEVVKRGFMSDFLFQNISRIFVSAPKEVQGILENLTPVKEPSKKVDLPSNIDEELSLNEKGEVEIPEETIIGTAKDKFGDKIYNIKESLDGTINTFEAHDDNNQFDGFLDQLKEAIITQTKETLVPQAKEVYGDKFKPSTEKKVERAITYETNIVLETAKADYNIDKKTIEEEKNEKLEQATTEAEKKEIIQEHEEKQKELFDNLKATLSESIEEIAKKSSESIVKEVEVTDKEARRKTEEDRVRDHLRGFSRTIPSFIMAYGDRNLKLENFDTYIEDEVFKDVTSITLDQFRFLRDGGDYQDEETKETRHFEGHLFDEVVFDDSVQEFLNKKEQLANYFDENNKEDIFDYIPPQKTNQIFTPKKVVKQMVDYLEEENPGCFDDSNKTFIDLYMKSGLYLTEIVKRLFNSEQLKKEFPNDSDRLNHIFAKQIYGLAPTEIIYRIAKAYVLGFNMDIQIDKDNLKLLDATPYAKDGTLDKELEKLFPEFKGE